MNDIRQRRRPGRKTWTCDQTEMTICIHSTTTKSVLGFLYIKKKQQQWKKRSERRKHCTLAVVTRSQKFSPRRRPPSRGTQDGQNLISWRWSLPLPTNPVSWKSMHTILSYRGNRPTNKHTDRGDYNTLCHSFASAQCNKSCNIKFQDNH